MNSSIKRLLALVLAVMFVAAACSSDSTDENSDGDTNTTEGDSGGDTTAPDDETVELTQDGGLLAKVQARGTLNCGVSGAAVAFSETQPDGSVTGFDADYCRAVAAAVLGDANAVEFSALTAAERFTAVQTGTVDLLIRNSTWTQSRDTDVGMDFGPTTYYDGQQIMGRDDLFNEGSTVADLDGAIVCTNAGTTTEKNMASAAAAAGVSITLNTFEDYDIVTQNFIDGACDAITTDGSGLVGRKAKQQPADQNWVIFPGQPISKEPLGPVYGQNDSQWADVVNWTVYATIIADELGVTKANVDDFLASDDGEITRLLGSSDDELQSSMGLSKDAFYQVISQVGNYTDIFDTNLGPVGIKRAGPNGRWNEGGLIYAPPAR